jgi:hypothetical protein
VDELAQAFSMLKMGMVSIPIAAKVTCPRMPSCPVRSPAKELPT